MRCTDCRSCCWLLDCWLPGLACCASGAPLPLRRPPTPTWPPPPAATRAVRFKKGFHFFRLRRRPSAEEVCSIDRGLCGAAVMAAVDDVTKDEDDVTEGRCHRSRRMTMSPKDDVTEGRCHAEDDVTEGRCHPNDVTEGLCHRRTNVRPRLGSFARGTAFLRLMVNELLQTELRIIRLSTSIFVSVGQDAGTPIIMKDTARFERNQHPKSPYESKGSYLQTCSSQTAFNKILLSFFDQLRASSVGAALSLDQKAPFEVDGGAPSCGRSCQGGLPVQHLHTTRSSEAPDVAGRFARRRLAADSLGTEEGVQSANRRVVLLLLLLMRVGVGVSERHVIGMILGVGAGSGAAGRSEVWAQSRTSPSLSLAGEEVKKHTLADLTSRSPASPSHSSMNSSAFGGGASLDAVVRTPALSGQVAIFLQPTPMLTPLLSSSVHRREGHTAAAIRLAGCRALPPVGREVVVLGRRGVARVRRAQLRVECLGLTWRDPALAGEEALLAGGLQRLNSSHAALLPACGREGPELIARRNRHSTALTMETSDILTYTALDTSNRATRQHPVRKACSLGPPVRLTMELAEPTVIPNNRHSDTYNSTGPGTALIETQHGRHNNTRALADALDEGLAAIATQMAPDMAVRSTPVCRNLSNQFAADQGATRPGHSNRWSAGSRKNGLTSGGTAALASGVCGQMSPSSCTMRRRPAIKCVLARNDVGASLELLHVLKDVVETADGLDRRAGGSRDGRPISEASWDSMLNWEATAAASLSFCIASRRRRVRQGAAPARHGLGVSSGPPRPGLRACLAHTSGWPISFCSWPSMADTPRAERAQIRSAGTSGRATATGHATTPSATCDCNDALVSAARRRLPMPAAAVAAEGVAKAVAPATPLPISSSSSSSSYTASGARGYRRLLACHRRRTRNSGTVGRFAFVPLVSSSTLPASPAPVGGRRRRTGVVIDSVGALAPVEKRTRGDSGRATRRFRRCQRRRLPQPGNRQRRRQGACRQDADGADRRLRRLAKGSRGARHGRGMETFSAARPCCCASAAPRPMPTPATLSGFAGVSGQIIGQSSAPRPSARAQVNPGHLQAPQGVAPKPRTGPAAPETAW
uniref:Kinesin motor domain-containing protein n=1 Tax=Macrostomum lignano TaxID=282301 RepID=A0A1I8JP33_9PLAT